MNTYRSFAVIAALATATICLSSCYIRISDKAISEIKNSSHVIGSEETDSIVFRPGDFNAIAQSGSMDFIFVPTSEDPRVVVTTSKNILDSVEVSTDENEGYKELNIGYKMNSYSIGCQDKAVIYYPSVKKISAYGSGDFTIRDGFSGDSLSIETSGSGDFYFNSMKIKGLLSLESSGSGDFTAKNIMVNALNVITYGSGDTFLSGRSDTADLSTSGSGDIDASQLYTKKIGDVFQHGSGSITCTVNGKKKTWEDGQSI